MPNVTARLIDIGVFVGVMALTIARWMGIGAPATRWGVVALLVIYLGWWLRRRSPYRVRRDVLGIHSE